MKKLFPTLLLLAACTQTQTQTASLEVLESKTGIALDAEEKRLIGKRNPDSLKRLYACQSLVLEDIVTLSEVGISDSFIIGYIEFSEEHYNLSATEIRRLERSGVSQAVIRTLIDTGM